ncbi:MAG: isochorismate synthase [Prosthecochloris sp.]|nr:isochorismate synthase [Prosthecochloris sp.]
MSNPTDITISTSEHPVSLAGATGSIKASLSAFASDETHLCGKHRLITFTARLKETDPLLWLQNQDIYPRIYWTNREGTDITAGIGKADSIEYDHAGPNNHTFEYLQHHIESKQHDERYFGGCCFNNIQPREEDWAPFKSLYFLLPQLQITRQNDNPVLKAHLYVHDGEPLTAAAARLLDTLENMNTGKIDGEGTIPDLGTISFSPSREEWITTCNKVLDTFNAGFMGKIILARRAQLEFSTPFSPLLFLLNYPFPESSTYRYYFEPEPGRAFFSFTPERLYRRDHDRLLTEALAGTCSREALAEDTTDACRHLLNSEKDIREHRFVKDTISKELEPICTDIDMEKQVRALQLNNLVHLYTYCKARLRPECASDATVLEALHPTPAVGGVPRDKALQQIMDLEPFSRGWYAGPVGWISRHAAEFAVGIRSALANRSTIYLFSGAGLVRGSNPASEWDEVDHKIGDMLAIARQTV